jgi:hypothetical protein
MVTMAVLIMVLPLAVQVAALQELVATVQALPVALAVLEPPQVLQAQA